MGRKTRKRAEQQGEPSAISRGYARGEARNQEIREGLEPLAPGERPGPINIAIVVALLCAAGNVVAGILSDRVNNDAIVSTAAFSIVLLVAAAGMWFTKYWAVLGFQALLALQVMVSSIAGIFALAGLDPVAIPLIAIAVAGGWLFWKLVRVLARIQMPERRPERPPVI